MSEYAPDRWLTLDDLALLEFDDYPDAPVSLVEEWVQVVDALVAEFKRRQQQRRIVRVTTRKYRARRRRR